ncbi:MAG: tRNA glutamyl-Q(34) synthetase GluQRS, partial [Verrucomicrobiaceae bacterium]
MSGEITRFAPSPTGLLHLGHVLAAEVAWREARRGGGTFLLRLEDIDTGRCRETFATALEEDLKWMGYAWPEPVWRQSGRMPVYAAALDRLRGMDLLYPCFCTRQEIAAAISAPQGPEGPVYPGTCRHLTDGERRERLASGAGCAWRLDAERALARTGTLTWHDRVQGGFRVSMEALGDVVLARRDIPVSYHLAVTVDDAAQDVTLVTRGNDLLAATHAHRLLQALLDLPVPQWLHHGLVCDEAGRRLAKRDGARSLR